MSSFDSMLPDPKVELRSMETSFSSWIFAALAHATFSSFAGVMWGMMRWVSWLTSQRPNDERLSSGAVNYAVYGVGLLIWCVTVYYACFTVLLTVLLFEQLLPEVAVRKIKALNLNRQMAVAVTAYVCSSVLSGTFLFRLDLEATKLITLGMDGNLYFWVRACLDSLGFFTFLAVLLMSLGHVQRIGVRSRLGNSNNSLSDEKKLPSPSV